MRPTTLPALLVRAAVLHRRSLSRFLIILLFLILVARLFDCGRAPPRIATFNIENYPKSARQEEGAFDAIQSLGVSAIAVQEITDPERFAGAAKTRLGATWALTCTDRPVQRVCVLYDGAALELVVSRSHPETEVYEGAKPVLEADLRQADGAVTRVFALHLKARGEAGPVRAAQLRALTPVVERAVASGDRVAVLGDFNATGPGDVATIDAFARATGLRFSSRDLACTSYWNRDDGCLGVALDQALTTWDAKVEAEGPCRDEGCAMRPSCPVFQAEVSDHCPVSVE